MSLTLQDKVPLSGGPRPSLHLWLTSLNLVLLVVAVTLNAVAFHLSSYITTSQFAPFLDGQLVKTVGGANASAQQDWKGTTRVGLLEICHTVSAPTSYASPEKCFSYKTDTTVATASQSQIFPSACSVLGSKQKGEEGRVTLDGTLVTLLKSVCDVPGQLVLALPVFATVVAFVTAIAATQTLFISTLKLRRYHRAAFAGATISALLMLAAYLIWTTVLGTGPEMHQGVSAMLTIAAVGVFVLAAVIAMIQTCTEVETVVIVSDAQAVAA